jgi:two-component system cell cycle sensor histidine kinase/response regulator CckA
VLGEDIELVIDLKPGVGSVRADVGQLQQVLLNLGLNARDAMPAGGTLTISTSAVVVDASEATERAAGPRPGAYVALKVSDTGMGMDPHVKARIFEPFFTTKELNRGTGLGLATVYGIVKQSDGYIDVTSAPNAGASFQVLLPRMSTVSEVAATPLRRAQSGSGLVLLVEDQEAVRRVISNHLRRAGYTVLQAGDGRSALEIAQTNGAIDLLLTDVVMPQMNGRVLAARLEQVRPDIKVLYMTGYSDDAEVTREIRERSRPMLQKPFTSEALLHAVRDVLKPIGA